MSDREAKRYVKEIFSQITSANTTKEVDALIKGDIAKNKMDASKYPPINFKISKEEIVSLQGKGEKGMIDEEGNFNVFCSSLDDLSPMEKLLYAFLWKQGDLLKVKHIVKGIEESNDKESRREKGIVFYQFGKYLAKDDEPIVDQHVLRAYGIYRTKEDKEIDRLRRKSTTNKSDLELIESYKTWLTSDELKEELREAKNYVYHIDQLLFALGKTIKKK